MSEQDIMRPEDLATISLGDYKIMVTLEILLSPLSLNDYLQHLVARHKAKTDGR